MPSSKKEDCKRLWMEVFGDTACYTDFYFQERYEPNSTHIITAEGQLLSMVHLNTYTLYDSRSQASFPLHYIVGVATKESERHKGLMSHLLKEALQQLYEKEEAFTYLMPADPAIYTPFSFCYIDTKTKETSLLEQWLTPTPQQAAELLQGQGLEWKTATPECYPLLARFANQTLEQAHLAYILRDSHYYHVLQKQMQAAGGNLCYLSASSTAFKNTITAPKDSPNVISSVNDIYGVLSYMFEEQQCEITELICPSYRGRNTTSLTSLRSAFASYFLTQHPEAFPSQCQLTLWDSPEISVGHQKGTDTFSTHVVPSVMGRIVHLKYFCQLLRAKEPVSFCFSMEDVLLPENSGRYQLEITPRNAKLTLVESFDSHTPLSTSSGCPQAATPKNALAPDEVWKLLLPYLPKFCIRDIT